VPSDRCQNKTRKAKRTFSAPSAFFAVKKILNTFESEVRTIMGGFFRRRIHKLLTFNLNHATCNFSISAVALMAVLAFIMVFGVSAQAEAACEGTGDIVYADGEQLVTSVSGTPAISGTIGDIVHIEMTTSSGAGSPWVVVKDSVTEATIVNTAMPLLSPNVYGYDWDTTGLSADSYTILTYDVSDYNPLMGALFELGNPSTTMKFYSDAGYTNQTDIFAQGDTIYVELNVGSTMSSITTLNLRSQRNTRFDPVKPSVTPGTTVQFSITADFVAAGFNNDEWGYLQVRGNNSSQFSRQVKRDDAGCSPVTECTANAPLVSIIPSGGQNISSDGGSANYTVIVTNADTGPCADATFDLPVTNTNNIDFVVIANLGQVILSPGASTNVPLSITSNTGVTSATTDTFVTATEAGHTDGVSNTITTTVSVCTVNDATINLTPSTQDITSDGGSVSYSLTLTNNDVGDCGDTLFVFALNDTNTTEFAPSTICQGSLSDNKHFKLYAGDTVVRDNACFEGNIKGRKRDIQCDRRE
jgi:hypothetical protein